MLSPVPPLGQWFNLLDSTIRIYRSVYQLCKQNSKTRLNIGIINQIFFTMNNSIYSDDFRHDSSCRAREVCKEKRNVMIYKLYLKNAMIVLMDHPSSMTLYRYVSVEVLSGSVSIMGFELKEGAKPLTVFSSEKTGLIEVKTETYDQIFKKKSKSTDLESKLTILTDDSDKSKEIMKQFENHTVVIVVRACVLPANIQYLELYYPHVIEYNLFKKNRNRSTEKYHVPKEIEEPIEFDLDAEKLASEIIVYVREAKLSGAPAPRILIYGPKNTGKSSLNRFLINKILSVIKMDKNLKERKQSSATAKKLPQERNCDEKQDLKIRMDKNLKERKQSSATAKKLPQERNCDEKQDLKSVMFLDTDPGQTEFTLPATVSLVEVSKPVIGPPFMHLKKPVSTIFIGGISPDSSPEMYCKSVSKLIEIYNENFFDKPLFVNTMGWMEGLGLFCLQHVLKIVKPTVLIELANEDELSMFDYRDYLPEGSQYFQLRQSFEPKQYRLQAQEMRDISVLAYLGKCLNEFEGSKYLNQMKTYRVCWDEIPVFIFGKKVPPYRIIEATNASIVALCQVPETAILESDVPSYPKTLEDEPDNECIGFGLVRAIDEKYRLLYIISPLSLKEIQPVNSIIKGSVMVPDAVFLNQPITDTPLPFTNEREVPPSTSTDENTLDCSMLSLISLSETESPATNLPPSNSVQYGRKKISKRFKQRRK